MTITVNLMGGLGNQLFQIFVVINYALKYNDNFLFEYSDYLHIGITRPTYWNNLLSELKKYTINNKLNYSIVNEHGHHYTPINKYNQNIKLNGYYQSYKYFIDTYDRIIELIQLKQKQDFVKNKYNDYFNNDMNISIHFRLGDYKQKQNYHPIMTVDYYIRSINDLINKLDINENINILYFCEKEDNEDVLNKINIIKSKINRNLNFIKVDDTISDWEQMLLMSLCNHNIIANSSFSWWGAFFNNNPNKIIYYPNIWFGPGAGSINVNDMFPNNWNKIIVN